MDYGSAYLAIPHGVMSLSLRQKANFGLILVAQAQA